MTYYTADYLYNEFKGLASMRKSNPAYENDHTYWDDGCCNWGGQHRLREDCQTMARGFQKLESLNNKAITDEMTSCTTKQEFDFKKSDLARRINEITGDLHVKTGASSSIFGVCCIWGQEGMSHHVQNKMQECQEALNRLRNQLDQTKYQWVEELKRVQFEIDKIETRMKENKQKALKETDPIKKQALIEEIEADGKLLQTKYQERNSYTEKFKYVNVSKYVSDLVEGMKKAIEKSFKNSRGDGSGGDGNQPNKPKGSNDPLGDDWNNIPSGGSGGGSSSRNPRSRNQEKKDKDNSQMILIAVAVAVIIFIMMNQKEKPRREYDEFDYY